jgi:hypothetical protein
MQIRISNLRLNMSVENPVPASRERVPAVLAFATAVANSPIVVGTEAVASGDSIPDWETLRRADNVDELILAWIAGHVRARPHSRQLN